MTFAEVKSITRDWKDSPPLVFLVESLVHGFVGEPVDKDRSSSSSELSARKEDEDQSLKVGELARLAGPTLPVVQKDPGLRTPTWDVEELRRRNAARQSHATQALRILRRA